MDHSVSKRKIVFNKFTSGFSDSIKLVKTKLLGRGFQGVVYNYCYKKICTAVKKIYLEKRNVKHIKRPFTISALKNEQFIELASMKLTNQLVLQKICPNFILNYYHTFLPREGICDDIYPYTAKYYNEYLDNTQTYTEWVQDTHAIEQWYNAYFQITVAIFCLQRHFNMTHLDLHSDNVLVCKVKAGGHWKYTINDQHYYVPNLGYVFYINDFGHAWIPKNFQSWIIRTKYKEQRVHKNFDIQKLFESTLSFSTSPKSFKSQIKNLIKQLRKDSNFINIIQEMWGKKYNKPKGGSKQIEAYNLDKKLLVKDIPKELRNVVLRTDTSEFKEK